MKSLPVKGNVVQLIVQPYCPEETLELQKKKDLRDFCWIILINHRYN